MALKLLRTLDQSYTLLDEDLNETYHSRNGAWEESLYVYIDKGLKARLQIETPKLTILEMGFGTGLNCMLTLMELKTHAVQIEYDSLEINPLTFETIDQLQYERNFSESDTSQWKLIHQAEWNTPYRINHNFSLTKLHTNLNQFIPEKRYDLIYFDAFAPDKQPELWSRDVFTKLYLAMNDNAILVTYSSKGEVKRTLRDVGFQVERLPGPPMKRHMLRAIKQNG